MCHQIYSPYIALLAYKGAYCPTTYHRVGENEEAEIKEVDDEQMGTQYVVLGNGGIRNHIC